jgi:hypothetical protein
MLKCRARPLFVGSCLLSLKNHRGTQPADHWSKVVADEVTRASLIERLQTAFRRITLQGWPPSGIGQETEQKRGAQETQAAHVREGLQRSSPAG